MKNLNLEKVIELLNKILEYELAGVVKYTHFALMVTGPNRIILDKFFNRLIIYIFFRDRYNSIFIQIITF